VAWFQEPAKPQTVVGSERYWLGSLSAEMRDTSGLMYKRNRYYNPQTGQFTQPDPIDLGQGSHTTTRRRASACQRRTSTTTARAEPGRRTATMP
jgi:RHS repeat-associated protein